MTSTSPASQATDCLLMVRPSRFGFNAETAGTNIFQQHIAGGNSRQVHEKALKEFDDLVQLLRCHKLYVLVLQDPGNEETPDSVFPNNWISFHDDTMVLYPMLAPNRRRERRSGWISLLKNSLRMGKVIDFSGYENMNQYLEGTGSMVLDRMHRAVYAALSSRTNAKVLEHFAAQLNFEPVCFNAIDYDGREIYHTNVMMAVGERTAVVCSEVIRSDEDRSRLLQKLSADHEVVNISYDQLLHFAGNILLVKNRDDEKFWVMSQQAFLSLTDAQIKILEKDGTIICSSLRTIETIGGGSARCMMAEIS